VMFSARAVCCVLVSSVLGAAGTGASAALVAGTSLSHASDYTFGYYPYGWRPPKKDGPIRFAVQTNRYAFLLDASRGRINRIGPIVNPLDDAAAANQGNEVLNSLPETELTFTLTWNGRVFPVGTGTTDPRQVWLHRVGKYLQHFSVQHVQIGGLQSGAGLEGVHAWMEGYAWSDRVALQLHTASYKNHLTPPHGLEQVTFTTLLTIPTEYPILEMLGKDDTWHEAEMGEISDRAVVVRNSAENGIALLTLPGQNQHVRRMGDGHLAIETDPISMVGESVHTFSCVVVPSADVRRDALREVRQMVAAAEGRIEVTAEGMAPYSGALRVDYDAVKGWHQILLGENADVNTMERVRVTLRNAAPEPCTVRLNFAKIGGNFSITGMSPILRDKNGYPIGLPIQISKNWHCAPPWFNGLAMLELGASQSLELEFDLAYSRWGGVPAVAHAQLCLVGYGGNQLWDEMSIGSFGESICYDADVNLGRSMVDDMRPLMVWGMGAKPKTQWSWTHNVGGCDFLALFTKDSPDRKFLGRQKTLYRSYGPVLTDVTYAGQTHGGALQSCVRTQSWRSDDYVRALYTLRYDVTKPVGNIDRLAFFQLGADHYNSIQFQKIARGSSAGMDEAWEPATGGWTYSRRSQELPGTLPWIGLYGVQKTPPEAYPKDDQGALADKAMIVRSWKAKLGGMECATPRYSVFGTEDGMKSALVELAPPPELQKLEQGDFVDAQIEVLVLPQQAEDYYGPNQNVMVALKRSSEPWALTLREAMGSNVEVKASVGTVENTWPVRIRAKKGQRAEFSITGGIGYTPVTISEVTHNTGFHLSKQGANGDIEVIDESSSAGNDWWQADYDSVTGTWALTFTLSLDTPNDERKAQIFSWRANTDNKQQRKTGRTGK